MRALALLLVPGLAFAQPKKPCDAAYEAAQELRVAGKLLDAKNRLLECSHPQCAAFEISDCSKWMTEVERDLPSIIVRARTTDGSATSNVRVFLDGAPLTDDHASIDPGAHVVRFEHPGSAPIEQRFEITLGEKGKELAAVYEAPVVVLPPPPARKANVLAFVLGGAGIVLTGVGLTLDLHGYFGQTLPLKDCAQMCPQSRIDGARAELAAGDVFLGVGIVTLGIATYFLVRDGFTMGPRKTALAF